MKKKILFLSIIFSTLFIVSITCIILNNTSNSENTENEELLIEEYKEDGIKLSKRRLASSNERSFDGYVVTATVVPETATTSLIWELNWKDSSVFDTITDFISYNVSSDTKSITLKKLKGFDNQIILTVCSLKNKDSTASCILDCMIYVRENSFEHNGIFVEFDDDSISLDEIHQDLSINGDSISFANLPSIGYDKISTAVSNDANFTEQLNYGFIFGGTTKVINHNGETSNSSYVHDFRIDIQFSFSDAVKEKLTSLGYNCIDLDIDTIGSIDNTIFGWFYKLLDESIDESDLFKIIPTLKDITCWFVLDMNIDFVDVKNSNEVIGGYECMYYFIDFPTTYYDISSISLDYTNILIK